MTQLLTTEEVAEWARTTRSAIFSQRHRGEAPGSLGVRVGRRILWRLEDLERWFEDQQKANHATTR
jgi:hypothetical protein